MPRTTETAQLALGLMDLTSLNLTDTDADIVTLCQQANSDFGSPAALCVYPKFIQLARQQLNALGLNAVKIATVTNFPDGSDDIARAVIETEQAIALGADEVDVVFPYQQLIKGNTEVGFELIKACKNACNDGVALKVIIESGELKSPELIKQASQIAIDAGADFIKTSTGKVAINATLEAAEIMLKVIRQSGKKVGFKAAGGVKTTQDAGHYLALAEEIMGAQWVTAEHFRFGASSLLNDLLICLGAEPNNQSHSKY